MIAEQDIKDYEKDPSLFFAVSDGKEETLAGLTELNYKENCYLCEHYNEGKYTCKAFPNRIPLRFLTAREVHDKVIEGQVDSFVFTKKK